MGGRHPTALAALVQAGYCVPYPVICKGKNNNMMAITEALKLGRESSVCCPEHRKNLEYVCEKVEQFVTSKGLITFSELTTGHVNMLVQDMLGQGYSASYVRHIVNAIRLASNYMADFHGAQPLRIEQRHLPPRHEQPKIWLSFNQLSKACQAAMDTESRKTGNKSQPRPLELGRLIIMACGLCGLRLMEFGRITRECLEGDPSTYTLTITETKNESSKRVIPVPDIVAQAMLEYWEKHGQWSADRTSNAKRVREVFKAAYAATRDDLFTMVPPKNLRKSLVNELLDDVPKQWIDAYCGWAFKGEQLRSYAAIRPKPNDPHQLREVAVNRLRGKIVEPIQEKINMMHF